VFVYVLVSNVVQRPDGITIALFFIGAIVFTSLFSRIYRSFELRQARIEVDEAAEVAEVRARLVEAIKTLGKQERVVTTFSSTRTSL
jgi:hypothetical protein